MKTGVVYESQTVDEAWNNFRDILIEILDKVAPVKEVRIKQRTKPWITPEILEKIKEKDRYLCEYKRDKNNKVKYSLFCRSRNKLQGDIKRI